MAKNMIMVDETDRNIVQAADVKMSSLMNIITYIQSRNIDVGAERFQKYEEDYQNAFFDFEKAKTMIFNKYLANLNEKALSWSLDYERCQLTYEY